jgi:hypothetical protein
VNSSQRPFDISIEVRHLQRDSGTMAWVHTVVEQGEAMSRNAGDRYECKVCGSVLVYEKPCPCTSPTEHAEMCCDQPMVSTG